jgi:UPF0755 protein
MLKSPFILAVLALIFMGFTATMGGFFYLQHFLSTPNTTESETTIIIARGMGSASIADMLHNERLVSNSFLFKAALKLKKPAPKLIAGEYLVPPHQTPEQLMALFASGKVVRHSLTIPEGLTSKEILALVNNTKLLTGSTPNTIDEGSLLPETYLYERGQSRTSLIKHMQKAMTQTLDILWSERTDSLPITTKEEALILASIVEKETGIASERPHIASVFINRLRINMPLQSDPTTIYGIYAETGIKKKSLTKADLARRDSYNTYTIPALPPTPIANPGKEALYAVLHPDTTNDLYFVANGTGGHSFASSLSEHNKYVSYYRSLQKPAK